VLALGKLRHPGIIRIIDAGRLPSGALYLSMEYAAGPDLQAAVGWDGAFELGDALKILVQLAAALAYAHDARIVHRDLKPANVILEDGDPARAKIIDFGLAKIAEDEGLTRLTEDKQAVGSPLYWAPEQSTNADVGPPADIYALGGIAYFVLTGEPMFKPRPAVAMVYAHQHEAPEPLSKVCRDLVLPAGLEDWIHACVAKAPRRTAARGGPRGRTRSHARADADLGRRAARPAAVHADRSVEHGPGTDEPDPPGPARSRRTARSLDRGHRSDPARAFRARARSRHARVRRRDRNRPRGPE
jgi:serine/threonine-protein kinase